MLEEAGVSSDGIRDEEVLEGADDERRRKPLGILGEVVALIWLDNKIMVLGYSGDTIPRSMIEHLGESPWVSWAKLSPLYH